MEIWSGSNNHAYMYISTCITLKKDYKQIYKKSKNVTAPILKPNYDQKLETFCLGPKINIEISPVLISL